MCVAIAALGLSATEVAMIGATVATTATTLYAQSQQAHANAKAIGVQSQNRANEIAQAAGERDSTAAMEARQARAQAVVAASGAGVNLGSNSFLASLQTSTMNQYNEQGLISENEANQQSARVAETNTDLVEKASSATALGALTDIGLSGAGAYIKTQELNKLGAFKAPTVK